MLFSVDGQVGFSLVWAVGTTVSITQYWTVLHYLPKVLGITNSKTKTCKGVVLHSMPDCITLFARCFGD